MPFPHAPQLLAGHLDPARVLLAGFIAGAAGGLASTAIALFALTGNAAARAHLPAQVRFGAIGIVAANAMLFGWTLVGLVLGAVYLHAAQPAFSIGIAAACVVALGGAAFVRRRVTWPMWSAALVAAMTFAVLLPLLAGPS